jgi:ATP-dependent protease ClpP protease subunit
MSLRTLRPFDLITHNVGNVDSIGNAVFLAGEQRYASPHSTFMFHGVGFNQISGGPRLEEKVLREFLDGLLSDQKRIGAIIEERTNVDAAQIEVFFREAQTKDVEVPDGVPVISLVFERQGVV